MELVRTQILRLQKQLDETKSALDGTNSALEETKNRECLALADDDRDIDLYHWSSSKFSAAWLDTLSVLVARGRAQVGVAAATTDWPKRIRDMRYADQDDRGTAD